MNSIMRPIFNKKIVEKWNLWICKRWVKKQCALSKGISVILLFENQVIYVIASEMFATFLMYSCVCMNCPWRCPCCLYKDSVVAWCIWGFKAKINYLVLDVKLLRINMNYIDFFFLKKFYRQKKFDKIFHICWYARLIVVSKKTVLVVDLDEN